MKKILKSRIFLVIITMVVSVGTTVCGAILYNANQVAYTPSDTTWNVSSVDGALNDLYNTAKTKLNSTTATQEEILSGKVAYSRGNLVTGTMANRGAVNATIDPGASYTIPAGYHNGSGKVTANNAGGLTVTTLWTGDLSEGTINVNSTGYRFLLGYFGGYHGVTGWIDKQTGSSYYVGDGAGNGDVGTYKEFKATNTTVTLTMKNDGASSWVRLQALYGVK